MNIFYNVFSSLIITSTIVLIVLFFIDKNNKLNDTNDYFCAFQLTLSIFPIITFSSYYLINAIFNISETKEMLTSLLCLMFFIIFIFSLCLYFSSKSSYRDHINNYLKNSTRLLNVDLKTKEKIVKELAKEIKKSSNIKYETVFYISINEFSLLIRSKISFYDYLRTIKNGNKNFFNEFALFIITGKSCNNTYAEYKLEHLLTTFELSSIDEIQDEHFKLFEMLNI